MGPETPGDTGSENIDVVTEGQDQQPTMVQSTQVEQSVTPEEKEYIEAKRARLREVIRETAATPEPKDEKYHAHFRELILDRTMARLRELGIEFSPEPLRFPEKPSLLAKVRDAIGATIYDADDYSIEFSAVRAVEFLARRGIVIPEEYVRAIGETAILRKVVSEEVEKRFRKGYEWQLFYSIIEEFVASINAADLAEQPLRAEDILRAAKRNILNDHRKNDKGELKPGIPIFVHEAWGDCTMREKDSLMIIARRLSIDITGAEYHYSDEIGPVVTAASLQEQNGTQ